MTYYLAHPTVEKALELANGNRAKARELIREPILAAAREKAELAGRSVKCQREEHADETYGCRNDGSGCICRCHDSMDDR